MPVAVSLGRGHERLTSIGGANKKIKADKLLSAEFVEVNPIIDNNNKTAKIAVSLIGSLLGGWLI